MNVHGYELLADWKVSNIGYTSQGTKGGKVFFLKRYGEYKMPRHDSSTSDALYNRLKADFDSFKNNRIAINEALSSLAGPGGNIILPTDWFVDDIFYIEASERVENLIEDTDILRLPKEDKLFIMLTAAGALHNIHRKKIVHSDLKRSNILAARNSSGRTVAKIIDFDRSYFIDNIRPEEIGGDQAFMSPELTQCFIYEMAEEALAFLSTKSDVFSLGLVFHDYLADGDHPTIRGLTGPLKERQDSGATVYCGEALLAGAQLVISEKITEPYLSHLLVAMLQLEPENRPTAQEVLEILKTKRVLDIPADSPVFLPGAAPAATPVSAPSAPAAATPVSAPSAPAATPSAPAAATPAPAVSAAPTGFCAPWSEHKIVFNEEKLRSSGYIASAQLDHRGTKLYELYKSDGSKRKFTVENLVILGMAAREGRATATSSAPSTPSAAPAPSASSAAPAAGSSDLEIVDDGTLWEEDATKYDFNLEAVTSGGYKGIAKATRKGAKGYALIKASGEARFMTIQTLKILRFVKAK